jgi:hypothetical protein
LFGRGLSGLLEHIGGAKHFTKIDLQGAYNLVRIRPGVEWKTAFRTRYGHYNAFRTNAIFQHMENEIFQGFLDIFLIIYLDDLLTYSRTQENMVFMPNWRSAVLITMKWSSWVTPFHPNESSWTQGKFKP